MKISTKIMLNRTVIMSKQWRASSLLMFVIALPKGQNYSKDKGDLR